MKISSSNLALADVSEGKFGQGEPVAREALESEKKVEPDDWERYFTESLVGERNS